MVRQRKCIELNYKLANTLQAKAKYFKENDTLNDMQHQFASLEIEKSWTKTKVGVELYQETADDRYIPPVNPNSRYPFDISEDTPNDAAGLRLRLESKLTQDLSFLFEGKQNFLSAEGSSGQVGLDYRMSATQKMYLRQFFGQFSGRDESRTAIGVESQLFKNTVAFNEYRLSQGADGNRNQQAIGLRNKFMLGDKITGNFSIENLSTLNGPERQNEPDAFAVATGIEYLPRENVKITSRLEYRQETGETSQLAEFGIAYKYNPNYSLLFKERFFYDDLVGDAERITSRTMVGLAYRPVDNDKFNALVKMEFKNDVDTTTVPGYDSNAYIISLEGVYQPNSRVQYIGKYAGKLSRDYGANAYTDLLSARVLYDLSPRWDMGLECRMLTSHTIGSRSLGGSFELGYRVMANVWLSAGYCFDKFDSDLAGDSYRGEGPFLKLRFKFGEGFLKSARGKVVGTP